MAFDLSRPPSAKGGSLAAQYGQMMNRRQPGGISSISPQAKKDAFVNIQRGKFFDGRKVPEERVFRRTAQDTLDRQFKNRFTRPVGGSKSNLLQMTADAPQSLTDFRMSLANRLGPTPREVFGDMAYAGGQILQNLAEKGTPLMNLAKSVGSGVQNFFTNTLPSMVPEPLMQNFDKGLGAFNNFMQSGQNFNMLLMALPPRQRRIYDLEIMKPGMTREQAYRTAVRTKQMAMGGVVNL